jgi:hypothetical protein
MHPMILSYLINTLAPISLLLIVEKNGDKRVGMGVLIASINLFLVGGLLSSPIRNFAQEYQMAIVYGTLSTLYGLVSIVLFNKNKISWIFICQQLTIATMISRPANDWILLVTTILVNSIVYLALTNKPKKNILTYMIGFSIGTLLIMLIGRWVNIVLLKTMIFEGWFIYTMLCMFKFTLCQKPDRKVTIMLSAQALIALTLMI